MAGNPYETNASGGGSANDDNPDIELGPGGQGARGRAASGRPKGKLHASQTLRANIVLLGLFLAGVAAVYGLSFRKGPVEASADQQIAELRVDAAILHLSQEADKSGAPRPGRITHRLLRNFHDQIIRRQVPLHRLRKNPFQFVPPGGRKSVATSGNPESGTAESVKQPRQVTEAEVMATLQTLRLQSVMVEPDGRYVAIISNNLVVVGQRIEYFTVKKITRKSVVLIWHGKEYLLRMG